MGTLYDLLKGTNIPGAGNRFWNWASKVSLAAEGGGGGGVLQAWSYRLNGIYTASEGTSILSGPTFNATGPSNAVLVNVTASGRAPDALFQICQLAVDGVPVPGTAQTSWTGSDRGGPIQFAITAMIAAPYVIDHSAHTLDLIFTVPTGLGSSVFFESGNSESINIVVQDLRI